MRKIRVLVVDDSFFMRKMISDLLISSGVVEVIDTAKNGLEAVEKTAKLMPDIVTLDVEMPKLNGLEALQKIMTNNPVPIIMLSSLTKSGTDTTIKALEFGAFDFVAKPSGSISFDIANIKNELIDKVLLAYNQRDRWLRQWNVNDNVEYLPVSKSNVKYIKNSEWIVAIGTSTGGPKALQEVITKIPKEFPYPILIVQHMPPGFTKSLADRLNSLSEITVVEAQNQELIRPGTAYIAPGNYHMVISKKADGNYINLNQMPPVSGHRPSVDIMFESLAAISLRKVFVIMTGMGSDGTKGLKIAKKDGDIAIAQDESTCVVYGMPKTAIQSGLVDITVPIYQIHNNIINSVQN